MDILAQLVCLSSVLFDGVDWNKIELFCCFLCSPKNFGGAYSRRLVRPSVRPSVSQSVRPSVRTTHSCPAHNFVIWSGISKLFYRNDHHVVTTCHAQHLGSYLEGQGHSATLKQNRVRPITLLLAVEFRKYFTEMITILRWRVARNIWVTTLKVKVTPDLAAKSCLANNFVIWSWISKIMYRNDHHIETTTFDKLLLCVQYLFGEHYPVPTGSCLLWKSL